MSDAFEERLARTRGENDQMAAAKERARAERERRDREYRETVSAAAKALLPELLASIEALRRFEEADPARTSRYRIDYRDINLGFFPDSAPVTFTRHYRPARALGGGSHLEAWTISAARGGLTIRIPRAKDEPLKVEPFETLEEVADAGVYAVEGRVVVSTDAFDAVIQTIADHIARGHGAS